MSRHKSASRSAGIDDVEATDAAVNLLREAREPSTWQTKQCIELVRGQLDSHRETRARRVQKEIVPKAGIRQQPTQCPFHVPLTHVSSLRRREQVRPCMGESTRATRSGAHFSQRSLPREAPTREMCGRAALGRFVLDPAAFDCVIGFFLPALRPECS